MPEKKFILSGPETITLAIGTVDKLIRAGDGDAALLYLYMRKTETQKTPAEIAAAMNKSPGWVASAMAVLSRIGLIKHDEEPGTGHQPQSGTASIGVSRGLDPMTDPTADEPRRYTAAEIKEGIEANPDFSALLEEVKRTLGMLSPDALERLFGIYDSLRMPPETIMLLITHCIAESSKKNRGGMPTMRYIEQVAYAWARKGILTLDSAEEYLKAYEERKSAQGKIKAALKIRDRELSTTEKKYVDEWIEMGFGADAVEIAHDRTVLNTGKPAFGYMNSIIRSWHNKGLRTAKEIMEKDGKAGGAQGGNQSDSAKKFGETSREEYEQMQRLLDKIKKN